MKVSVQIWGLGAGICAAAVIAGGFFLGVSPALAQAAQTDAQTAQVTTRNQAAMATLEQLSKQGAKVEQMKSEQAVLMKAVPTVLKPNTFIRRVQEVAAIDDVVIQAVTPGDAVAYIAPPSVAAAADTAGSSSTSAVAAAAATASGTTAPALASTSPLITSANFTVVPMTVEVSGSTSAVLQFAHDISNDQRVFAISNVSTASGSSSGIDATFMGNIYTLQR